MGRRRYENLNRLELKLPEGLLVDAAWLAANGYSSALRSKYVASGRLEQPARSTYRRPRGALDWQQVVVSLQTLLETGLVAGGRTALELQGYAHYLQQATGAVHLYGQTAPPAWLGKLDVGVQFRFHNAARLFPSSAPPPRWPSSVLDGAQPPELAPSDDYVVQPWGQWRWPMVLSTPERALLELLEELPGRESFHQVDMLMEGLATLRPARMARLLKACDSIKVKRLFFFFADRHQHAWTRRLDPKDFDLGHGKRMLVRGGRLDERYQITVPGDLSGGPPHPSGA
jgi:hypothetical protein